MLHRFLAAGFWAKKSPGAFSGPKFPAALAGFRPLRLALPLLFAAVACFSPTPPFADLVFKNGKIHPLAHPGDTTTSEALAVRGERIVFVGSEKEAGAFVGPNTQVIDLQGKTVLPGLTDAHVHPISGGLAMLECDLTGIAGADSILARLAAFAKNHPERPWLRGENFWLPTIGNGNPHKSLLDKICPDRPAFVSSADGHSAWVNSKALALAGITSKTPDPENGRIERDPRTGEPTGTLREDAIGLVSKLIPEYSHAERLAALRTALKMAASLGLTNLVEASAGPELADAYLDLAARGELTAHVSISLYGDIAGGTAGAHDVLRINHLYRKKATDDVRFNQVKLFMDGVVEGKTASMLRPYEHEHANTGIANCSPETADSVIAILDKAGLQIHVHAIGDRGIRMTLDAFEHAQKTNGRRDARHHIAHLHVMDPAEVPRFRTLGVAANFQSLWATTEDSYMTDMNFPYLGPERSEHQYPIGTVARTGARLVFGSDWPVSTMNPFEAAQVAITRRGPDSLVRAAWTPQHLINLQSVIEGYARGGAWLTFRESDCGSLETGKLADLAVLDRDVFRGPKFDVHRVRVVMTLFRGKVVWEKK